MRHSLCGGLRAHGRDRLKGQTAGKIRVEWNFDDFGATTGGYVRIRAIFASKVGWRVWGFKLGIRGVGVKVVESRWLGVGGKMWVERLELGWGFGVGAHMGATD